MADDPATSNDERERPDLQKIIGAIVGSAATLIAVAGSIIAFVMAGRLAFRFGLFLIIAGGAVLLGVVALQIWRNGRVRDLFRRWGRVLAFGGSLALIVSGTALVVSQQSGSAASCSTPAQVSGADTSASSFTIGVHLQCSAPSNESLHLVVQFLDEGTKGTAKHSEYYLGWAVKNTVGQQSFYDSPHGCVPRRYYLISVTQDQLDLIQSSERTSSGAYYGDPVDAYMGQYIWSNVQINHTCNK